MPDLSAYHAIIFDMDGTLIDSMPTHVGAWQKTCEKFNVPFDEQWLHSLGGKPTQMTAKLLVAKHNLTVSEAQLAATKIAFFDQTKEKGTLIPATYQVLQQYKGKKTLAIGTGAQRRHAQELLTANNVIDDFDAIVTANDVIQFKPEPETFLKAAELMGVNPAHCVVFEDTLLGQQAAESAGMDCYLIEDGKVGRFFPAKRTK